MTKSQTKTISELVSDKSDGVVGAVALDSVTAENWCLQSATEALSSNGSKGAPSSLE